MVQKDPALGLVNHKRVEHIVRRGARLPVKRRRRKKVPVVDRQPSSATGTPQSGGVGGFCVRLISAEGRVLST